MRVLQELLAQTAPADRVEAVIGHVGEVANRLLGDSSLQIDPDRPFIDYGYSSLVAIELARILSESTGLDLPAVILFEHPTPRAVATHVVESLGYAVHTEPVTTARAAVVPDGDVPWRDDDIAIVGMSCRFPEANGPNELWDLVSNGIDAVGPFPRNRGWDLENLYNPDPEVPKTTYVREAAFLDDISGFDPAFFHISPREAMAMDPQQRLLLEGAWEAMERAGLDIAGLKGSATGVFIGSAPTDYVWLASSGPADLEGYWGVGTTGSVASGRISYIFGFEGPTLTVDTACSSSLVAIHLARRSLQAGECSLALAGAVALSSTPSMWREFSRQRVLAADGRCRSFSADATGTGWGEGMGMVVLERMADARAAHHPILGIIRGSAINHDGASNGLTAPRGSSQQQVIRDALASAGIGPADVDAVEAHGTGTALGDPIEARALQAVYGSAHTADEPLHLGSLKSNIGHCQAAAGVGGLQKMVMALLHERLPRTLHVAAPTPAVDWESSGMHLLTEEIAWTRGDRPRRAGISAFGIGGTNAHVIVEEPPAGDRDRLDSAVRGPVVLVMSAHDRVALAARARGLVDVIGAAGAELDIASLAAATACGDQGMSVRAAVVGDGAAALRSQLVDIADGTTIPQVARKRKVAFVFPGQGAQLDDLVPDLLDRAPTFAAAFGRCARVFADHRDEWDETTLEDIVRGASASHRIGDADVIALVNFATYVSMAALWTSYGLDPDFVVGHSQGEIAAAHVAGMLSLEDAALIITTRTGMLCHLAESTGLLAIAEGEQAVSQRLPAGSAVVIAAVNGPASSVLSGPRAELEQLRVDCETDGVRATAIVGAFASHSALMDSYEKPLTERLAGISPRAADVRFCSSVTADLADGTTLDHHYWFRAIRSRVRFEGATQRLLDLGVDTFVEMSPRAVLSPSIAAMIDQQADGDAATAIGMSKGPHTTSEFLRAVARVWDWGGAVAWPREAPVAAMASIATYPFDRQRYWIDLPPGFDSGSAAGFAIEPIDHPIMTGRLDVRSDGQSVWIGTLSLARQPWLADHAVCGVVLAPAVAFLELAALAADHLDTDQVDELIVVQPLPIPEDREVRVRLIVGEQHPDGSRAFTIESFGNDPAEPQISHAEGRLGAPGSSSTDGSGWDERSWPPPGSQPIDVAEMYRAFDRSGVQYGAAFQGCAHGWESLNDKGIRYSEVDSRAGEIDRRYIIAHPAMMDASFHIALGAGRLEPEATEQVLLPFSWTGIRWTPRTGPDSVRVRINARGPLEVAMSAVDDSGRTVVTVDSVAARPIDQTAVARLAAVEIPGLYFTAWTSITPDPVPTWEQVTVIGIDSPTGPPDNAKRTLSILDRRDIATESADLSALLTSTKKLLVEWTTANSGQTHLTVVTSHAVAVDDTETPNPSATALWGFLNSAAAEHPGRISVVDLDADGSLENVVQFVGIEPAVAVRSGQVSVPRVTPLRGDPTPSPIALDPNSAVLVSGGTSGIGAILARHLAVAHGVRRLVLLSRSGESAPGAVELVADLEAAGCSVTTIGVDVADADALERALSTLGWPIGGIVHSAGVLDDATVAEMTDEQVSRVLRPKVDGIRALEAVCAGQPLGLEIFMSSIAGTVGAAGQSNYAAANAFLDGHAMVRRRSGVHAVSIVWGLWELDTTMSTTVDADRLRRGGLLPLSEQTAMTLFDAAVAIERPAAVIAAGIDLPALNAAAQEGLVPPILERIARSGGTTSARSRSRQDAKGEQLRSVLSRSAPEDHRKLIVEAIRAEVAAVLRYDDGSALRSDQTFKELGMDSLGAVELRNRIARLAGVPLPISMAFDHPTPERLADSLIGMFADVESRARSQRIDEAILGLRSVLVDLDTADRDKALSRVSALVRESSEPHEHEAANPDLGDLFDFIDRDLGVQ